MWIVLAAAVIAAADLSAGLSAEAHSAKVGAAAAAVDVTDRQTKVVSMPPGNPVDRSHDRQRADRRGRSPGAVPTLRDVSTGCRT